MRVWHLKSGLQHRFSVPEYIQILTGAFVVSAVGVVAALLLLF